MPIALTRPVSPRIAEAVVTYMERTPIEYRLAEEQHAEYERVLARHGCEVVHVDAAPDCPDGVFVEDAAIVLDEVAVITRPGAKTRQGETSSMAATLERYRPLEHIVAPGTIDGGDVLIVDRTLYVGRLQRTNDAGIRQLRAIVKKHGYEVVPVEFTDCLHLKTAVTQIGPNTLIINPDWVDPTVFGLEWIEVDRAEPFAANVLRLGETLVLPAEFPHTRRLLEKRGFRVDAVHVSEMLKAEAGVTCCSVIVG